MLRHEYVIAYAANDNPPPLRSSVASETQGSLRGAQSDRADTGGTVPRHLRQTGKSALPTRHAARQHGGRRVAAEDRCLGLLCASGNRGPRESRSPKTLAVILPDVNVSIYAFRADLPQHPTCRAWLDQVVLGDTSFGLSPLVLGAVVRITTNPRIFKTPSSIEEAFGFCGDLLGQPHSEIVEPGSRHWSIFQRLCVETNTRGPLVSDA